LLRWIDEEVGIYAMSKLRTQKVVTRFISEINFIRPAHQGDVIEIGLEFLDLGSTSISFRCQVRNLFSQALIISIEKIVFVKVDDEERPSPHGLSISDMQSSQVSL